MDFFFQILWLYEKFVKVKYTYFNLINFYTHACLQLHLLLWYYIVLFIQTLFDI